MKTSSFIRFPRTCALLLAMAGVLPHSPAWAESPPAMNVLFIVSDDLNSDVGAFGSERAVTPELDRLAARSMTFQRAYCQYPACGPSRNSFLSGLRPNQVSVPAAKGFTNLLDAVPDATTLPRLFRDNGYYTAQIGKIFHITGWDPMYPTEGTWENDDPDAWDHRVNPKPAGLDGHAMPRFDIPGEQHDLPGPKTNLRYWSESPEPGIMHDDGQTTEHALNVLEQFRTRDQPFFLAVGYRRPHVPFVAPEEFYEPFPLESMELPPVGDRSDAPYPAFNMHPPNDPDDPEFKAFMRAYLASVSFLDSQVGRLIDRLEATGQMENTIIVFFSDHGFHLGEHGNWHKFTLFEESARTPMIIRVPGMTEPGGATYEIVELVDLYPTLRELCGLPAPNQELVGRSLVPLLEDPETDLVDRPAFTQVNRKDRDGTPVTGYSLRTPAYRYNEWWTRDENDPQLIGTELYDLERDPSEEVNLADDPALGAIRAGFSRQLQAYRAIR